MTTNKTNFIVRKSLYILVSLYCCLLISSSLSAQLSVFEKMKDPASFLSKLTETSKNIKTIESDFIQEKHLAILSDIAVSKGHFLYKKENMLRWEYIEPFNNVMVMKEGRLSVKDEDQVVKQSAKAGKIFKKTYGIMRGCISGDILKDDHFETFLFENKERYLVELIPRQASMKKNIKKISLYFNREEHTIWKIVITEASDDFTSILFLNQKLNVELADERFLVE